MKSLLLKLNIKIVAYFYVLHVINKEGLHFNKDFKQICFRLPAHESAVAAGEEESCSAC